MPSRHPGGSAVQAGAHTVYCGFADETNARNFPGLNFSREDMHQAVAFAHQHGSKVMVAINTFPRAGDEDIWHRAIADAESAGVDAVILADVGLLAHATAHHPELRLHLTVQAAAANPDVINYYASGFGVGRVVLPRVLSVAEIAAINGKIDVDTEVFVFGGLCVMAEGRCSLSSYATGKSPNMQGVCSPASHVQYVQDGPDMISKLGAFTINKAGKDEPAPYPTLCKGCFSTKGTVSRVFEEPTSRNTASPTGSCLERSEPTGATAAPDPAFASARRCPAKAPPGYVIRGDHPCHCSKPAQAPGPESGVRFSAADPAPV